MIGAGGVAGRDPFPAAAMCAAIAVRPTTAAWRAVAVLRCFRLAVAAHAGAPITPRTARRAVARIGETAKILYIRRNRRPRWYPGGVAPEQALVWPEQPD